MTKRLTEQLDYEPAHFFKRRIVRRKGHAFADQILAPPDTLHA